MTDFVEAMKALSERMHAQSRKAVAAFAEDMVSRVQDLVPVQSGNLRMNVSMQGPVDVGDQIVCRVGANGTVGKKLGPSSKRSEAEPESISPCTKGMGGSELVSYAILTHELMAFSQGPRVGSGHFEMGRSDIESGGRTLDEAQMGIETSDGDRGGQYMRRPQMNGVANHRRWKTIAETYMRLRA